MKTTNSHAVAVLNDDPGNSRHRLRRLIVLVICTSIAVHLVAAIGAGIWVIARYFSQPKAQFVVKKTIDMKPEDREHRLAMEEVAALRPKPVYNNRIQSLAPSKLALPELPTVPLEQIVPLDTDALVSDQIDGVGHASSGGGQGDSFFGRLGAPDAGKLEGTFYDLKQTRDGRSTDIVTNNDRGRKNHDLWLNRFVLGGMRANGLDRFYQAPKKVYMSQLVVPNIPADTAPKAFGINVPGSNWVIVYRGQITPPKDGTYRFAGYADDTLIVRVRNRLILDGSWQHFTRWESRDRMSNLELPRETGISPNSIVFGDWIQMKTSESYPIEILVGEQPGGWFCAALFIQDRDETYTADAHGRPILPRFRVAPNTPEIPHPNRPYAPDGPVFRAGVRSSVNSL